MPICTSQMNVRVDDRGGGHSDLPTPEGKWRFAGNLGMGSQLRDSAGFLPGFPPYV